MFNKRENNDTSSDAPYSATPEPARREPGPNNRAAAVIGPSIHIDGTLRGDEDLLIEGKVKGTVELKKNSVTIGAKGEVTADIYAHTIYIDGSMKGNLVAAERVVVRKSARISGSITAPRVSLEDGARFNGSIDMDPETETLKKAFSGKPLGNGSKPAVPPASAPGPAKPESAPKDRV
jgi:cytoskeletal protein CcmA (bactofilin family)